MFLHRDHRPPCPYQCILLYAPGSYAVLRFGSSSPGLSVFHCIVSWFAPCTIRPMLVAIPGVKAVTAHDVPPCSSRRVPVFIPTPIVPAWVSRPGTQNLLKRVLLGFPVTLSGPEFHSSSRLPLPLLVLCLYVSSLDDASAFFSVVARTGPFPTLLRSPCWFPRHVVDCALDRPPSSRQI